MASRDHPLRATDSANGLCGENFWEPSCPTTPRPGLAAEKAQRCRVPGQLTGGIAVSGSSQSRDSPGAGLTLRGSHCRPRVARHAGPRQLYQRAGSLPATKRTHRETRRVRVNPLRQPVPSSRGTPRGAQIARQRAGSLPATKWIACAPLL